MSGALCIFRGYTALVNFVSKCGCMDCQRCFALEGPLQMCLKIRLDI